MTAEVDLDRLRSVLLIAGELVVGRLRSDAIAGGRSNITIRVEDEGGHGWVLRRPPIAGVIASAHDVTREYRVVRALGPTPVPVPRAVTADDTEAAMGFRYGITEYVPGVVARTRADVADWSARDFQRCTDGLLDSLVELHAVDPVAVGLGDLGRHDGYAARQLRRWAQQWQTMGLEDPREVRLRETLQRRIPAQTSTCVVHGDFRIDNVLLDPDDSGTVLAILDWELSTLGDPFADVGLMCAYRHDALDLILDHPAAWTSPDLPAPDELLARYEERRGERVTSFDFHLGLAHYKLAGIAAGIDYRLRLSDTPGATASRVGEAVAPLLEAGLQEVSRHV